MEGKPALMFRKEGARPLSLNMQLRGLLKKIIARAYTLWYGLEIFRGKVASQRTVLGGGRGILRIPPKEKGAESRQRPNL